MTSKERKKLFRIIFSALLFTAVYIITEFIKFPAPLQIFFYSIPYFVCGYDVILKCAKDIMSGEFFSENFLMTIATVGAFAVGEYPEAVFVMMFSEIGTLFESIAIGKSRNSISRLTDIIPDEAEIIRNGETMRVSTDKIEIGDTVLIKAGERVPVDGKVISGNADINTSALTGESLPIQINEGCSVMSGSVALNGAVRIKAEKTADNSAVSKIVEMIESASSSKAKSEKFITSFSRIYTPAVVIAAVLTALVPSLITRNVATWIHRALIFLVVSCPCALVISVPLTYFGGIGAFAKNGILAKGSDSLEALAKVKNFVFDKTGTLTEANFNIKEIKPYNISIDELLYLSASIESASSHPLAHSLVSYYSEKPAIPKNIKEISGFGITGEVNGKKVAVGNEKLMKKMNIENYNGASDTSIFIAVEGIYSGCITFTDTLKPNSYKTVDKLKKQGNSVFMLSGDRKEAVVDCASKLGIDSYGWQMLPEDKAKRVKEISSKNGNIAFIGDGINDAPCLAASDVGIAMGALGSDLAIECADIIIADDDPLKVVSALNISKKAKKIVIENIVFALSIKVIVLLLAVFGIALMWEAVIADVGVSVIAIINSLRLLKSKS